MTTENIRPDMSVQVGALVMLARQCARSARRIRGTHGSWLTGHCKWEEGRAAAYLIAARYIAGSTPARYRNAVRREMDRQAADLCGVAA